MLRFDKTKVGKERFYGTKKTINIWVVHVDNIVIKSLIRCLDKVIKH